MELKQVQCSQSNHAERILRLEKRHADDAALKSVWNSPFPGVIGGTPQQGPVQIPHSEMFDDLDEQGEQLLGSLHLGPAEEEPVRRGAASRANSVRFDESALHGSSWAGQGNRQSGDFGPIRPGSGLMMERSLSHKSDGRHSSAGHSVHSHHSVASGRASSLGLDTNFAAGDDDSSSFEMPGPPVSLYVLGTVPSIVRCWLTTNYAHDTLLYADICTGSQKSTVDYSLIKELDLVDELERDVDGLFRARLNVYLAEAVVTQHNDRTGVPAGSVPSMTVSFEVMGMDQPGSMSKAIRIYIGSDALRTYSADVLFSQNKMVLFGNERDRLQVPFVRPEDDGIFRHICTANMIPEKPKLNANAMPFVLAGRGMGNGEMPGDDPSVPQQEDDDAHRSLSPLGSHVEPNKPLVAGETPTHGGGSEKLGRDGNARESNGRDGSTVSDRSRRESSATTSSGIWTSWRQGAAGGADGPPLSGYQPAARGGRSMKVLRPHKSGSMSARVGAPFETSLPSKSSDGRRKSQTSAVGEGGSAANGASRWEAKRTPSLGSEVRPPASRVDSRSAGTLPRSANPVGVASAFSWMTPPGKPAKASATSGGD
ncbi:ubiquitin carboxyl-terminal hydrolase 19 [Hirsutella rhossiliensis]|uniref:Ubiquitin carboxyl-terminal hydrolase 19 n=1 Tax=Hirsutella rhossiliensis TaxID=111463 RepID=A0A9P8N558_9HYPO|nr:ubiquitin carboxyl-terminal hydrolase 19 [Hirsutella rhossiliensis]KAH0966802.1 ubiquitin carboxyl-terminal hydrolase 19 [Hirsutella rhossiliensis]